MSKSLRLILRILSYLIVARIASAQTPEDTAKAIASIDRDVAQYDTLLAREVWPGYHFTKLGVMYVVPNYAKVAAHWPSSPPEGMHALPGFDNVVWTDTGVVRWQGGLPVASLAVASSMSRGSVAGLAMHEAFHAFEVTQRRNGRRFGAGENSMVTARYPVFDVANEAYFAVEAQLLREALLAKTDAEARRTAQQFLTVRAARHARLDSTFVNYELAAEMHEGMAQYTLLKGLAVIAARDGKYAKAAAEAKDGEGKLLASTLTRGDLSVRRRVYATGSWLGLLLDRFAIDWKSRVMEKDEWVHDILASAVGQVSMTAATKNRIAALMPDAVESVNRLRSARVAKRDSLVDPSSFRLIIDPTAIGRLNWCGFDPQNLLPTGTGQLIHARMLNLCDNSGKKVVELYQPSVETESSGRIETYADPDKLQITEKGTAVTVHGDNIEITFARAHVVRGKNVVMVVPF